MTVPAWFLYVSGFSLVILGLMQLQARPRQRGASLYERFVNVGTLWSLCCITVGVGILLMALGWWTPSFLASPRPVPRLHRR
jgi:hypothetical protein